MSQVPIICTSEGEAKQGLPGEVGLAQVGVSNVVGREHKVKGVSADHFSFERFVISGQCLDRIKLRTRKALHQ